MKLATRFFGLAIVACGLWASVARATCWLSTSMIQDNFQSQYPRMDFGRRH